MLSEQEKKLLREGMVRDIKKNNTLQEKELSHLTHFGKWFISNYLYRVVEKLRSYIDNHSPKVKLPIDVESAAYLATATLLSHLKDDTKLHAISLKIGTSIEREHNARLLRLNGKHMTAAQLEKALRSSSQYKKINTTKKSRIGQLCIQALCDITPFFHRHKISLNGRQWHVVSPTKEFYEIQTRLTKEKAFFCPFKRPLLESPIPYDDKLLGGYAFDVLAEKSAVSSKNISSYQLLTKEAKTKDIAQVLNKTQAVPYVLNKKLLDIAWKMYTHDIGNVFPPMEEELKIDENLLRISSESEKKKLKKKYYQAKKNNASIRGKRLALARTMMIAQEVQDAERFYFPTFLDTRGRIYYHGDYLNPQGHDLAKALLLFEKGKKIEEPFFYFVHGANCYGVKGSYRERYSWIERRHSQIKEVAKNPTSKANMNFWTKADDPWQFLAFCLDYDAFSEDPENYQSNLRCSFDASSSGLQILSTLVRDKEGMKQTNVLDNGTEIPSDIYIECANILMTNLKGGGTEDAKFWHSWLSDKPVRKLVKRNLMTTVYSLSRYGLQSYVEEFVAEYDAYVPLEKLRFLGNEVHRAVRECISGGAEVMDWIKEVTEHLSNINKVLTYITPFGFILCSEYRKPKFRQIQTAFHGNTLYINHVTSDPTGKINKRKSINASVPNFIHALDACLLHFFVKNYPYATAFSLVHDSIYFRAGDVDTVYELIREVYSALFTKNILLDLKNQLQGQYNMVLPDEPKYRNKVDLKQVEDAPYLYH